MSLRFPFFSSVLQASLAIGSCLVVYSTAAAQSFCYVSNDHWCGDFFSAACIGSNCVGQGTECGRADFIYTQNYYSTVDIAERDGALYGDYDFADFFECGSRHKCDCTHLAHEASGDCLANGVVDFYFDPPMTVFYGDCYYDGSGSGGCGCGCGCGGGSCCGDGGCCGGSGCGCGGSGCGECP
jgi:hypothetical protein